MKAIHFPGVRTACAGMLFIFTIGSLHAARCLAETVKVQIDPSVVVSAIPPDFLGFGYETSAVAQPGFFSAKNQTMVRLYRNLGSQGLIRIGGNVSDHTRYIADGTPAARTEREVTIINRQNLLDLGGFARATGWRVMWGLNLGSGTKEQAADEAQAVDEALGASLQSLQVGNEVDLMPAHRNNYDGYHAAYLQFKTAIRQRLPHAVFSGPDAASNVSFVDQFVASEAGDMSLATYHYYRTGAKTRDASLEFLLKRDEPFDQRLDRLHEISASHHIPYRINEVNSFYGGGKQGVSDTFGAALWCLDYLFNLAAHDCAGVNLETDINQLGFISHYSPIVHDARGVCSARPEYYAMLAFALAGRGQLLKTQVQSPQTNVTAYATRDEHGAIYVIIINKDLTHDVTIECPLPSGYGAAAGYRLTAPSADAKTQVTFAGSQVAADGSWTAGNAEAVPFSARSVTPAVPHASALVIRWAPRRKTAASCCK
jgi:hypothetical protein